ncbi:hypothetical protein HQQ82_04705 [Rathayibacter sp. VKM Ac-2856]|nr:hypothetical protein [Rathayibacter sp. VKM Ac-2858]NQX19265.1 hypothetical protein [Rathayibacter sp. VKM Ac-2856]
MDGNRPPTRPGNGSRPLGLLLLVAVLALETAAVACVTGWLLIELVTTRADTIGGGIAIVVLSFIALAWVAATTVGTARRRSWIRASALTIQLVMMAVALGAFQGQYAVPDVGWALLAPALVAVVLLFLPSTVAATRRDPASS